MQESNRIGNIAEAREAVRVAIMSYIASARPSSLGEDTHSPFSLSLLLDADPKVLVLQAPRPDLVLKYASLIYAYETRLALLGLTLRPLERRSRLLLSQALQHPRQDRPVRVFVRHGSAAASFLQYFWRGLSVDIE